MRNQGRAIKALLGAGLLAGALGAAQAEGFYIGGNIGQPNYRANITGVIDGGSGDAGYELYGGYQFNPYFGLEGGYYDLGKVSDASGHANGRGFHFDAVGTFPLTSGWALYGLAGYSQAEFETSTGDDSSPGFKVGAGVQYDFTKQMAMRLQYQRTRFTDVFNDKLSVDQASLGLKYAF